MSFDTDWHYVGEPGEPAFLNDCENYGEGWGYPPLRFMKGQDGIVRIQGHIKTPTSVSSVQVFTLPADYWPDFIQDSEAYGGNETRVYQEGWVYATYSYATSDKKIDIDYFHSIMASPSLLQGEKGDKGDTGEKGDTGSIDNLPIGTVIMYDGLNWQDNVTLEGFYACVAGNSIHGCPDMEDSFVMGKAVAGLGVEGGENTKVLTTNELPAHSHGLSGSGKHQHRQLGSYGSSGYGALEVGGDASIYYWTYNGDGSHTHTVDSQGAGAGFDNRPKYYSAIYIRKCV